MNLTELPELAIAYVASFLTYKDVISMRMTCNHLRKILPKYKKVIFKGNDFKMKGQRGVLDLVADSYIGPNEHYFDSPLLTNIVRVASLKMSMRWVDQGWGNRKGEVWVQLVRGEEMVAECRDTFGVAEHKEESVEADMSTKEVVKMAKAGDKFKFMMNVGGGGGHTLTVKDFTVCMVTVNRKKDVESTH